MFSDILHDIIVTLIVTGLGALYRGTRKALSKNAEQPTKGSYSPKLIKSQFWCSLLVYSLSLAVIFSFTWEFSFTWPVILKGLALILAFLSFVLLWGAFDAAFAHTPGDQLEDAAADREAEHGRQK